MARDVLVAGDADRLRDHVDPLHRVRLLLLARVDPDPPPGICRVLLLLLTVLKLRGE